MQDRGGNGQSRDSVFRRMGRKNIATGIFLRGHQHKLFALAGIGYTVTGKTYRVCLPESGTSNKAIPSVDANFLLEEKKRLLANGSDKEKYFLAELLRSTGKNEDAYEIAQTIADTYIRKSSIRSSYEEYYLSNNREKVLEAARLLNTAESPSGGDNSGGIGKAQWYAASIPEAKILVRKPTPLAYELAMQIKDNKSRFKTLLAIYNSAKKIEHIAFPGCRHSTFSCVEQEMIQIAEKEDDSFSRDYMYGQIAKLEAEAGNDAAAKATYDKIQNPDKTVCHFDMCFNSIATPPKSGDPYCAKTTDDLKNLSDQEITKVANCQYKSGAYDQYLGKPESLEGQARNAYFLALTLALQKDGNYPQALQAAASINDTEKKVKAVQNMWPPIMPIDGLLDMENLQREEERGAKREQFITAMLQSPHFQNDKDVWRGLLEFIQFTYWNKFDTRIKMTAEQEKRWEENTWSIVETILQKMPNLNPANCKSRDFYLFENQCELQTLVVRKKYQEAMQLFDESHKALAARAILFERFMSESKNFRDSMNSGFSFDYIFDHGRECPIKRSKD